jgi:hypothetical protein
MIRAIIAGILLPWIVQAVGDELIQGDGTVVTETRAFETYDQIELRVAADMHVTIGKPTPLTIEADQNIMPLIKMEVRKDKLIISSDRQFTTKKSPSIIVTIAKLQAVEVIGAGDMWIKNLDNENLSVATMGAADIHLAGKTKNLTVSVIGAADVDAFDLDVENANATLTGQADAKLNVTKSLIAAIIGPSDLSYRGNPTVTKTIIGDGDITQVKRKGGS